MARNQRQRKPLQQEGRPAKQTVRERAQQARRQRERIEEQRDRRALRRDRERERRQTVDSVRSPKEDLRTERTESRIVPVEDTFLGRPIAVPTDLPVLIGERWALFNSMNIADNTETTIIYDDPVYTTERNGYPRLYQGDGLWRIPSGLSGIWQIMSTITFSLSSETGDRISVIELADTSIVAYEQHKGDQQTGSISTTYDFLEGDEFEFHVTQDSGGTLELIGGSGGAQFNWAALNFIGK